MTPHPTARTRVLAIASAGGHFNQLMRIAPAFDGHQVTYLTTLPGLADSLGAAPSRLVPDCNAHTPLRALGCMAVTLGHVLRLRPHAVITTGALPGVIAILCGRLIGARTLWIDSVANAEELSASGRLARRIAHDTLSQWPAVAAASGTRHEGSVL